MNYAITVSAAGNAYEGRKLLDKRPFSLRICNHCFTERTDASIYRSYKVVLVWARLLCRELVAGSA